MWVVFAFGSAFFAGLTSILAKCGIKQTDSNVATAIRTVVVLIFSWIMVFLTGSQTTISSVGAKAWIFLILSGLATGASWLCYYKAVLTMVLALILLGEGITWIKGISILSIAFGTYLMIQKKETQHTEPERPKSNLWFIYAVLSAVFASLTAILGKVGISGVESNLGTAIRTCVVLLMAWVVVFVTGKQQTVRQVPKREFGFICLSGLATGASWLCYYKALRDGLASVVVPIDKLSILVTIAFSYLVFKEKLNRKALAGLVLIVAGTLAMLL